MAKLNRANTDGSVSIVIPKKLVAKLGWQLGDYIEVITTESDDVLKLKNLDWRNDEQRETI